MTDVLISIIQSALEMKGESPSLSQEDVCEIEPVATRQAILYIIIAGLKNMGRMDLLTDSMKTYALRAQYDYIQRRETFKQITTILEEAKISFIPLKWAALREFYPEPCMRTSSDIDVLVHDYDIEKAIRVIESSTSFKYYKHAYHDVHFINNRIHLELHFSLLNNIEKSDKVLERAWKYTFLDGGDYRHSFTEEFQIFYISMHAAKHFIKGGGMGIRPLLDLWLLRTKTDYDETKVKSLCEEAGILGYYETCCRLLSVWFEGGTHNDVTEEFEKLVMSGGVFGSEHSKIVSHTRKNKGKYVIRRIIKPSNDIKEYYPICKKHPFLVPIYQIIRWTHLLRPSKRRAAYEELKHARSVEQSDVERYDKLLRSMGL